MLGNSDDARIVRAAAQTAADPIIRWWSQYGSTGVGLRGGTFTSNGDVRVKFRLKDMKWVEDLAVSGTVVFQRDTGAIQATLVAKRAYGSVARLTMDWNDFTPLGRALVAGTIDRRPVSFNIPAP
jgi:hypothetical protein